MRDRGTDLYYLTVLLVVAVGLGPAIWGIQKISQNELARAAYQHRYHPVEQGRREVHFIGKAQELEGPATTPPSGRRCLAWRYDLTIYEGANDKVGRKHCHLQGEQPFALAALDARDTRLRAPPGLLVAKGNKLTSQSPAPAPGCPPYPAAVGSRPDAVAHEYCLRPGEWAEVWACRESDRLTPCGDGQDALVAPPAYRNTFRDSDQGTFAMCGAAAWVLVTLSFAIFMLSQRVVELRPSGGGKAS